VLILKYPYSLGCTKVDEEFGKFLFLALVAFIAWFFWDGDTAWSDENKSFFAVSEKCNSVGICDIEELEALTSLKVSVNKASRSIVFLDPSGRIMREAKNCTISDKENFICPETKDEMFDDRFVQISGNNLDQNSVLIELSPASWRLNWVGSRFTKRAATLIEEALSEFKS
jgi:hypothetical protein